MNNIKKLSIVLLLSMGVGGVSFARGGNDCFTCTKDDRDCDSCFSRDSDCKDDCSFDPCDENNGVSSFLRPRTITTDLTNRNALYFYHKYHDGRCNFFTWDTAYIYQENRRERCLGKGFLGSNPLTIAETADNDDTVAWSLNWGLGANAPDNFKSEVSLCPRRKVFAWLTQLNFNLDCFCTGLWFDVAFAVVRAKHDLRFFENNEQEGEISGEATTVKEAFNNANVFARDCRHTGVDDVEVRLGYDYYYCNNDHVGLYFVGSIPTGKNFDNSRWFQPIVGSKHGGAGAGFTADYTICGSECDNTDLVAMTEFKYQFKFRHDERRIFDLTENGPLSRFLLAASENNRFSPQFMTENLTSCVRVEPRHTIDWWIGLHYQWCNWAFEGAYNLFWRDQEKVCGRNFDFGELGIFDATRCGNLTSDSDRTISDLFGQGQADVQFTKLTPADVNLNSGAAAKALSHKVSGVFGYNNVWCDNYPYYVGVGGAYEFSSKKRRRSTLENWAVFGKLGISF